MDETRPDEREASPSPAQLPERDWSLAEHQDLAPDLRRTGRGPLVWIIAAIVFFILLLMIRQITKADINGGDATIESRAPDLTHTSPHSARA